MRFRSLFLAAYFALILAGGASLCLAQDESQTKAHVSSRLLSGSERLEFSWDSREKVPFTLEGHGNKVVLHFDKPVALEWGKSLKAMRSYVRQVETKDNGSTVILTLNQPAEAHHFRSTGKNGIAQDKSGIELTMEPQERGAMPIVTLAATEGTPHQARLAKKKMAVHSHAKHAREVLQAVGKPYINPAHLANDAAKLAVLSPSAGKTAPSVLTAPSVPKPSPVKKPTPEETSVQSEPKPRGASGYTPPPMEHSEGKETITLPLKEDQPFAVFIRHRTLWIVADRSAHLSPDSLGKIGSHFTGDAQDLSSKEATVLTLPLTGDFSASVEKSSAEEMRIVLQYGPQKLSDSLTPSMHTDSSKHISLILPVAKTEKVISLSDPLTGDELRVVPLFAPGTGFPSSRSFVEFKLLQSAQGIVVQKIADNLTVSIHKGLAEIASPKGLTLSAEIVQQLQEMETEATNARTPATLFPYARWKLDDEKNLVPMERKLTHDIAYGATDAANKSRLKLLGIYLSAGLFPEARGMADDILRVSFKFYRDNKVAAMRGASYFFMYRIGEAEHDFSSPELMNVPEAAMWRSLCKELLGEGTETFNFSANYDRIIRNYPPVFIQKLAIIAADRSINRKEYDAATNIFDTLRKDNFDEPVKKYIDYMHAKILSETRNEDEAAKIWEQQAGEIDDPLIRARAEFSLVNMLLLEDKITPDEAIKRLEKLRIVWRGDSLELSVLTLLGNLYIEEKQYGKALHTLRDIVLYYPEMPDAITTARKMEEIFLTLYNKGGADTMPPLEALSLFYEFRDLVPVGKDGDQMIRNLADRLVGIDLLDRAAMLLDHQIRKRLQGDERSRIGARLALIYLLNHQPKEALETLKTTGYGDLPADLQLTRLRLTAQALAQQNQVDKAIDVLSSDTSPDGSLLRLSIYWDNKDWPNVVATAEEILGNRNDPSATLTPLESDVLLKLATAYVYEHDTGQIQYLRDYFTPLLKKNPNKDGFLFITSESGSIDYQNLANLDSDISAMKSYLDTYRDKVKKNGLSQAIN